VNLKIITKQYQKSTTLEKNEAVFLFVAYITLLLVTIYLMFVFYKAESYVNFYTEPVCLIMLGLSLLLLLKGFKNLSVFLTFVIYGNFYLLRILIFPQFMMSEVYPFSLEIYYAFQITIIFVVGYFCSHIKDLILTISLGLIFNIIHGIPLI
jgi:hypothetical protein